MQLEPVVVSGSTTYTCISSRVASDGTVKSIFSVAPPEKTDALKPEEVYDSEFVKETLK